MEEKFERLINELLEIRSPDGSEIDITNTTAGKQFLEYYNSKDRDEFKSSLYGRDIDIISDENSPYIECGFSGNSIIKIKAD
jgi:hypothetical protein